MEGKTFRGLILGMVLGAGIVGLLLTGAVMDRNGNLGFLDNVLNKVLVNKNGQPIATSNTAQRQVIQEDSAVIDVVNKATPSVVTVSMVQQPTANGGINSPFDFFNYFGMPQPQQPTPQPSQPTTQDIGTGFIISADGLIVTNKHVVADTTAKYKVVIGKDDVEDVAQIYRDPVNDLAILKVNKTGLTPINLGDSSQLKVGQTVIAIGTALGEFRSTVTRGVISGLGRGITAGSPFEGSEQLDNVIQTDAAINPGNSGGPLLDLSGSVIGVDVAVSQQGQNIGFALPINIVKDSINTFKTTGEFERPFLGVAYRTITKQTALLNDVPAGALVQEVVANSPASKAGIQVNDIITDVDNNHLADGKVEMATYINSKKIGDTVNVKVWRDSKEMNFSIKLEKRTQ